MRPFSERQKNQPQWTSGFPPHHISPPPHIHHHQRLYCSLYLSQSTYDFNNHSDHAIISTWHGLCRGKLHTIGHNWDNVRIAHKSHLPKCLIIQHTVCTFIKDITHISYLWVLTMSKSGGVPLWFFVIYMSQSTKGTKYKTYNWF